MEIAHEARRTRHGAGDPPSVPTDRLDVGLALLLLAGTVGYLAALPLTPLSSDEGHLLHAAKRLLEGEVIYRDVFDLTTPGWTYLMAAQFRLFGSTLATARLTTAVVHGATALLMFLVCRWLGVRRSLAVTCGLTELVVCHVMFPVASHHWLTTGSSVALLALCLHSRETMRWAFGLGVAVGLIMGVHQQRGFGIGLAVATFLLAGATMGWRHDHRPRFAAGGRQLVAFCAGTLLIGVPMVAILIALAGFEPVWTSLIVFPIVTYRGAHAVAWGTDLTGGQWFPLSPWLKYLPVVLLLTIPPPLILWWQRHDAERARASMLLSLFCLGATFSISYYGDSIHIALIAPFFFIATMHVAERILGMLRPTVQRPLGTIIASVLVLAGGGLLARNLISLRASNPVPYASPFGRIDLPSPDSARHWDLMRAVVDAEPSRQLFVYPVTGYVHLLAGAKNPTRFALMPLGRYTPPEHVQEIVDTLARKRVPLALIDRHTVETGTNPILTLIRERYEPTTDPEPFAGMLWRLKPTHTPP